MIKLLLIKQTPVVEHSSLRDENIYGKRRWTSKREEETKESEKINTA